MTQDKGQVPEVLRPIQRFNNICGLMNPETRGLYVRYEDHVAAIAALHAAHVQNPAEIEHVAGDVSKNRAEVNMNAYAELPPSVGEYKYGGGLYTDAQMRVFADATHALRTQQPAPATQQAPQQKAQEPCPTCAALARTVMLDQVSFDRKPDCYGIRQITDDEGVEEWEDIRTSPDVAREEANDMMATGRGEIYEVVPLWTTPQHSPTAQADSQPAQFVDQKSENLSDKAACASPVIDKPAAVLDRARIREIFMAHGFTVKEGQTDLKQYVYDAADALLRAARAPADSAPAWASQAVIEYRYTGGTHWCQLGPAERMKPNFDGVYRLQGGVFPVDAPADSVTAPAGGGVAGPEWKWVPVDATDDMVRATDKVNFENEDADGTIHNVWNTMLAAAPTPPAPAADGVLEDAARWQWLADYLIGERTDLDEGIVACATIDALRQFADAARKQGANHD